MNQISDDDIVISGISGRFPNSHNLHEFWTNLINSNEMYSLETNRWPTIAEKLPKYSGHLDVHDQFDAEFFDVSTDLANYLDPQQRLFYETTYESIYDSGYDPFSIGGYRSGCYIGTCYNDTQFARFEEITEKNYKFFEKNAQFVCSAFNLKGVALSVDTACAASFSALHQAVQTFKTNEVDRMVIGGLSINQKPSTTLGFSNLRMLSVEGKSKCLDAKVDGYCRSEAIVSIFLQRRKEARRIYATIYHSSTNCDGYKPEGITFPSMEAQYKLITQTYKECKIDPERHITYVEGHITGTPVGDPIESNALLKALRPNKSRPVLIGCLKSSIGHSEGASALCGLSKACLIFQHNLIPANINYETPNPNIEGLSNGLLIPVLENTPFDEDYIAINAFGFGGVNVHSVLKANERNAKAEDYEIFKSNYILPENWYLDKSLHCKDKFYEFVNTIKDGKMLRLINIVNRTIEGCEYTIDFLQSNQEKINNDYLQLIEDLSFIKPETKLNYHAYMIWSPDGKILSKKISKIDKSRPLYFLFNGLGSQWPKMGRELLRIKICAEKLIKLTNYTKENFDFNLIDFLCKEQTEDEFNKDLIKCSISILSIQIALIDLFKYLEINAEGYIGYSIGEYAVAYIDGCATDEQILQMMYEFSKICKENLEEGEMLSVGLNEEKTIDRLKKFNLFDKLSICCINSNDNTTIGGRKGFIDEFINKIKKEDIFLHKIETCKQAFHSKSFEKAYLLMLDCYKEMPNNNLFKKRSSKWLNLEPNNVDEQDCLSTYLAKNLKETVDFSSIIKTKLPDNACCLEIGPSCQLLSFVKQEKENTSCIPLFKKNSSDIIQSIFISIGQLFNLGGLSSKISKLFTPVQYPVSRQTLSLSHLIKFDHHIPRFVYRFPEYYNSLIFTRFFTISYDNPSFKNFYDHVIDGRILLPATSYLFLAWQSMAEKTTYSYKRTLQIPIEFFNISFKRAILLNKNTETVVKIKINEDNGRFCILESDQVCCAGRMNLIKDCEYKIYPTTLKPKNIEGEELLVKSDIYKEFRVRGYDYQGDFQGLVEAYASGRQGKVKWNSSWIAFSDSLLQIAILNESSRNLFIPTYIEYLRCETDKLVKHCENCTKTNTEPIFDVFYDPVIGTGATIGILVKGIRVVETPRKFEKQKPVLQKYCFVPYETRFNLQEDIIEKLKNYEEMVLKLIKGFKMKIEKLEEVDFDLKLFKKNYDHKELYSIGNILLEVLKSNYLVEENKSEDIDKQAILDENNNLPSEEKKLETNDKIDEPKTEVEKLDLNKVIRKQQEIIGHDFIFANHFPFFLSNHLAILLENINTKQIKILEISFTFTLLYDYIKMLLNSCQVRFEYNLIHPIPVSKSISSKYGINKVLEVKQDGKISKELNPSHLIIYKHWSTGYLNTLDTLDLSYHCVKANDLDEKEMIKSTYEKLLDGGFLMFCYRKRLTLIEKELMELGNQIDEIEFIKKEQFLEWILICGFESIGSEETDDYGIILARKVCKDLVQIKREVEPTVDCKKDDDGNNDEDNENKENNSKKNSENEDRENENKKNDDEDIPENELVQKEQIIEYEDPLDPIIIEVRLFNYDWVEKIQNELKVKSSRRIWLISTDCSFNGIVGLVKSLKREPEGERIRCLMRIDDCKDYEFFEYKIKNGLITENNEKTENFDELRKLITDDLIRKDLSINIIESGKHGSYRQIEFSQKINEKTNYALLDIMTKGDMNSFCWIKSSMKENFEHPNLLYPKLDYRINKPFMLNIFYSSINFKDVMVVSGRVPVNAYPIGNCTAVNLIGMEASGKLEDGRRVMCILPGSGIATKFMFIDDFTVFDVPDDWSLAQAATVPVAYLTSYYSLIERGNLIRGEKVLIHAGAGGVGFAAISICLSYGCEVFTTVSTDEKKEFLKKHFPTLTDRNFANSRDIRFEEHILKETDGYGVDIILNCLVEEKLRASIRCLSKFGRFIEIGKYDIMENNVIDTTLIDENKSLHVICLAHLYAETVKNPIDTNPNVKIWKRICNLLKEGIKNKQVIPLEYTIFSKDESEKAFHYMSNGKHKGKILIEIRKEESQDETWIDVIPKVMLNPSKVYIITGGLGGYGIELAIWLTSVGARKIVLTTRHGIITSYQKMQVRKIEERGANVKIMILKCDTLESTREMLDKSLDLGPIGGIFHLAMVLQDSIFVNQTKEFFEQACESKINSTFFLDYLTRKEEKYFKDLDYFICFSSVASALGNGGQSNYTFANSSMERIVEKRANELKNVNSKCKSICIQWGAVADVGVFAAKFGNDCNVAKLAGIVPQRIYSCLKMLDKIMNFNDIPILSCVTLTDESKMNGFGNEMDIVKTVMHLLGVQDTSTLDPNITLQELGMDSLMAVEIKQALEREYDIIMSAQEIRNLTYKRLTELSEELEERKKNLERDGFESEQDSLAKLEEIFALKENLFIEISTTTSIESSQPLFFIPSLESDFVMMRKLIKYITRPIIGINWLDEFDEKSTIKDVANTIAKRLVAKYGNCEFDLVGYSFGAVLNLEIVIHLQKSTSATVRKIFLLDGSYEFTKAKCNEMINKLEFNSTNKDEIMNLILIRFAEYVIKLEGIESLEDQLTKLPDFDSRSEKIISLVKNKFNFDLTKEKLSKVTKSIYNKLYMIHCCELTDKFKG